MGGTFISPNIRKVSERINPNGDVINARTKQIIKPVEQEFMPPSTVQMPEIPIANKVGSKIDEMINNLVEKKVEEIVAKKVSEVLDKMI